jgi:hypothetical protein
MAVQAEEVVVDFIRLVVEEEQVLLVKLPKVEQHPAMEETELHHLFLVHL